MWEGKKKTGTKKTGTLEAAECSRTAWGFSFGLLSKWRFGVFF